MSEPLEEKIENLENAIKILRNPAAKFSYKMAILETSVGMLLNKWIEELKKEKNKR